MKQSSIMIGLVCLLFMAAGVQAGESGKCSPEGTWYGYNTEGYVWIVTITRSGPSSFTTVMDFGPNIETLDPEIIGFSDWRGEFVKTGPKEYDWTTMSRFTLDTSVGLPPFAMGLCPLTAEFTSCDSFQGAGTCDFYGHLTAAEDPFEDGFYLFSGEPLQAYFKRMPMQYPSP